MSPASPRVWLDVSALRRSPPQPTGIPRVLHCLARELLQRDDLNARLCVIEEHRGLCETNESAVLDRCPTPVVDGFPRRSLTHRIRGRLPSLFTLPDPTPS